MRRAQADVVREQGGAEHVVVAVHRVGAPDHRDLHLRIGGHRGVAITVGQGEPVADAGVLVLPRPGTAAVEHRADVVLLHLRRRDRLDFGLGHLADLLRQRHAGHDRAHALFQRRVGGPRIADGRPVGVVRRPGRSAGTGGMGTARACQRQGKGQKPRAAHTNHGKPHRVDHRPTRTRRLLRGRADGAGSATLARPRIEGFDAASHQARPAAQAGRRRCAA